MKQGQASSSGMGSTKVEPKPKAISPEAVANIGRQQVSYKKFPMYEGRGLKAPMVGTESHPCGSQGRH
jgi:hypothetical protein